MTYNDDRCRRQRSRIALLFRSRIPIQRHADRFGLPMGTGALLTGMSATDQSRRAIIMSIADKRRKKNTH